MTFAIVRYGNDYGDFGGNDWKSKGMGDFDEVHIVRASTMESAVAFVDEELENSVYGSTEAFSQRVYVLDPGLHESIKDPVQLMGTLYGTAWHIPNKQYYFRKSPNDSWELIS